MWGWQLDNELSHYDKQYSYSPAAAASFRNWLRAKYRTIDRLNEDWGTSFWSMRYSSFDQIEIRDGINEGDDVVARAGALLREGDPVRPITMTANGK